MISHYTIYECDICGKTETVPPVEPGNDPTPAGWKLTFDIMGRFAMRIPAYVICSDCAAKIADSVCDFGDALISKAVAEYLQRMKEAAQQTVTNT